MTTIENILERLGELKPLPGTVVRLISVVNDPRSTVDDIVETIRYDQAVTGQMLRIVNSAFFGMTREVDSINEAMRCLGTVKVMQLVMAIHTNSLLGKRQIGYGLPPGRLWEHSVGVALASVALGEQLQLPNRGLLFTAGLLHDIGKVILNEYVARDFASIAGRVQNEKISFAEAEQQVLGFGHDEIGARVAENWKLPDSIVRGIKYHHRPSDLETPDPLVDVVHLADCVCLLLGIGLGTDGLHYRADESVMARHNLGESDLETLGAMTLVELKRVEEIFQEMNPEESRRKTIARQDH